MPGRKQRKLLQNAPDCWDYLDCPESSRLGCPAYPHMGRECWKVTGTKCDFGRMVQKSYAEKILYCRSQCPFFRNHLTLTAQGKGKR
jgi:hypothetical protein